jgi:thiol-disulfide isomerase/thioredoxin
MALMVGAGMVLAAASLLQPLSPADLQELLRGSKKPVVVNVWATWCLPCVEEFPEVLAWAREAQDKARVLFVSADFSQRRKLVVKFLQERGVDFVTYLKEGSDEEFIAVLSSQWTGALPATFVFAPGGQLVAFKEGKVTKGDLDRMLAQVPKKGGQP